MASCPPNERLESLPSRPRCPTPTNREYWLAEGLDTFWKEFNIVDDCVLPKISKNNNDEPKCGGGGGGSCGCDFTQLTKFLAQIQEQQCIQAKQLAMQFGLAQGQMQRQSQGQPCQGQVASQPCPGQLGGGGSPAGPVGMQQPARFPCNQAPPTSGQGQQQPVPNSGGSFQNNPCPQQNGQASIRPAGVSPQRPCPGQGQIQGQQGPATGNTTLNNNVPFGSRCCNCPCPIQAQAQVQAQPSFGSQNQNSRPCPGVQVQAQLQSPCQGHGQQGQQGQGQMQSSYADPCGQNTSNFGGNPQTGGCNPCSGPNFNYQSQESSMGHFQANCSAPQSNACTEISLGSGCTCNCPNVYLNPIGAGGQQYGGMPGAGEGNCPWTLPDVGEVQPILDYGGGIIYMGTGQGLCTGLPPGILPAGMVSETSDGMQAANGAPQGDDNPWMLRDIGEASQNLVDNGATQEQGMRASGGAGQGTGCLSLKQKQEGLLQEIEASVMRMQGSEGNSQNEDNSWRLRDIGEVQDNLDDAGGMAQGNGARGSNDNQDSEEAQGQEAETPTTTSTGRRSVLLDGSNEDKSWVLRDIGEVNLGETDASSMGQMTQGTGTGQTPCVTEGTEARIENKDCGTGSVPTKMPPQCRCANTRQQQQQQQAELGVQSQRKSQEGPGSKTVQISGGPQAGRGSDPDKPGWVLRDVGEVEKNPAPTEGQGKRNSGQEGGRKGSGGSAKVEGQRGSGSSGSGADADMEGSPYTIHGQGQGGDGSDGPKPEADESKPNVDESKPKVDESKPNADESKPKVGNKVKKVDLSKSTREVMDGDDEESEAGGETGGNVGPSDAEAEKYWI